MLGPLGEEDTVGKWPNVLPTCLLQSAWIVVKQDLVIFILQDRKLAQRVKGQSFTKDYVASQEAGPKLDDSEIPESFPHEARKRSLEVLTYLLRLVPHWGKVSCPIHQSPQSVKEARLALFL